MKSKIFTVAGLIMTAIFMMYFILAVNFTNALFPDKNSSYIALGVYVAAAALSFVIAGVLRIAEAASHIICLVGCCLHKNKSLLERYDTDWIRGYAYFIL